VKNVVKFLRENYDGVLGDELNIGTSENRNAYFGTIPEESLSDAGGADDDMYDEAKAEVIASGKASTSYLQRKLGLGYSRAAKIIDMLEQNGVIGPSNGSKPREIIGKGGSGATEGFGREED
jgi:DNA segregation ATPase FtsK/SpoIIIE-like protein